ncbi:MAG TPA: GtrA family protein [Ktedonobacteraceae bacterium]|nr:GtrA family protein [Ktedonobacteraceae bacterium]
MEQSFLDSQVEQTAKSTDVQDPASTGELPSYQPTRWGIVNRILDRVDDITRGKAGWCQRFFIFACVGGVAALVNLAIFAAIMYGVPLSTAEWVHNVIASVLAAEISIIANFLLNDYFTFRNLEGHARSWGARFLRFNITCVGGALLTFLIEFGFRFIGHIPAIIGQAAALIIVLFYNFSFHHIFTYRQIKTVTHKLSQ